MPDNLTIDLTELVSNCFGIDEDAANDVIRRMAKAFGAAAMVKHLELNAPVAGAVGMTADDYIEITMEIRRTLNTANIGHTYFVIGIRNLIMAALMVEENGDEATDD